MSSDLDGKGGGKGAAEQLVEQSKALVDGSRRREEQLTLLEPVTPEEMAEAQARLGPNAGNLAVLQEARKRKPGRPKNSRNKRSADFANYILSFGQHPAITMMQIQSTAPEVLVERSRQVDPVKRRMSYADAQALRVRCAEGLMPFIESKMPVRAEIDAKGDFNLLIPGVNISDEDARAAAGGTFTFVEGEFVDIEGEGNGG